jgi:phosphatidylglycerophosphate synthase
MLRWAIPNALSLLRILLAAVFPWTPISWRGALVAGAALSDLFDGQLSRALHGTSTAGQVLDPVADKLFVGSVLLTLVLKQELALVEVFLVGFRDLAVVSGSAWAVIRRGWRSLRHMSPSWTGKLTTAAQFGFLWLRALGWDSSSPLLRAAEAVAVVLSVIAGISYLCRKSPDSNHETSQLQHS